MVDDKDQIEEAPPACSDAATEVPATSEGALSDEQLDDAAGGIHL